MKSVDLFLKVLENMQSTTYSLVAMVLWLVTASGAKVGVPGCEVIKMAALMPASGAGLVVKTLENETVKVTSIRKMGRFFTLTLWGT